jgi:hypothetical protein
MDELMSQQEIHEFGIQIVLDSVKEDGYDVLSANARLGVNPQIVAVKHGLLAFIAVRTACYPYHGEIENQALLDKLIRHAQSNGARLLLASVGIANADGKTDAEMSVPVRGAGFYVSYKGLEELHPGTTLPGPQGIVAYNRTGDSAAHVDRFSDGRHLLHVSGASDFNSAIMSIFAVCAETIAPWQREIFSSWAGLPANAWTSEHRAHFALAMMHWAHQMKEKGSRLPQPLLEGFDDIDAHSLPPLRYELTQEIVRIFESLFVE